MSYMPAKVFWKDKNGDEHPVNLVMVSDPYQNPTIEIAPPIDADRVHSECFVVMFLGFLTADTPELHRISPPRLLASWEKFKQEMGK